MRSKRNQPNPHNIQMTSYLRINRPISLHKATPAWFVQIAKVVFEDLVENQDYGLKSAQKEVMDHSYRLVEMVRHGYSHTCQCCKGDDGRPKAYRTVLDIAAAKCPRVEVETIPALSVEVNGETHSFPAIKDQKVRLLNLHTGMYDLLN